MTGQEIVAGLVGESGTVFVTWGGLGGGFVSGALVTLSAAARASQVTSGMGPMGNAGKHEFVSQGRLFAGGTAGVGWEVIG